MIGGETFDYADGVELAHQLADSERVHDCYALRWARYATGVHLTETAPGVDALLTSFRHNDRVRELLENITESDMFRHLPRQVDP